jgi:hypothetical protein
MPRQQTLLQLQPPARLTHRLLPLPHRYGPEAGYASFRATLSDFLTQHYAAAVPSDHLMVTAGGCSNHPDDSASGVAHKQPAGLLFG